MNPTALAVLLASAVSTLQAEASPPESARLYTEALKLFQQHNPDAAVAALKRIIDEDPSFDRAYEKILEIEERLNRADAARAYFESVASGTPGNPYALLGLAIRHRHLADSRKDPEELQAAFDAVRRCVDAVPEFAPAYRELVDIARQQGRLKEITRSLEESVSRDPGNAALVFGLGHAHDRGRDVAKARKLYEESIGLRPDLWEAHRGRFFLLFFSDKLQALSAIEAVLAHVVAPFDLERRGRLIGLIGDVYLDLGDYAQAMKYLEESLAVMREIGDKARMQAQLARVGMIHLDLGRTERALDVYQETVKISREIPDRVGEGRMLGLIAHAHFQSGHYAAALHNFLASAAIAREVSDRGSEADQLSSISNIYTVLGDYTKALEYVENAVKITREQKDTRSEGRHLLLLGSILEHLGETARATEAYEQASELARGMGDKVTEATSLSASGKVYASRGNLPEASRRTETALRIAEEVGAAGVQAHVLDDLGRLRLRTGDGSGAEDAFKRSLTIAEAAGIPERVWRAHAGLATVYEGRRSTEEALLHYRSAIETIESVRGRLAIPDDRAGFLQDKVEVYRGVVALLVSAHESGSSRAALGEAFQYAERARARSFLDMLAEAKVRVEQGLTKELVARRAELEGQIAQIQSALIREHSSRSPDKKKVEALEASLKKTDENYRALEREIRREHPRYAELHYPETIGLDDIQKLMGEKSLFLEYIVGQDASFLFVIARSEVQVARLPGAPILDERVRELRRALSQPGRAPFSSYLASARDLYRDLIRPAEALLEGKKDLFVVPDGSLHYLPFEVLLQGSSLQEARSSPGSLPYLVRDFTVSYAPSASVLATLLDQGAPREPREKTFVAFGDPAYGGSVSQSGTDAEFATRAFEGDAPWTLEKLTHSGEEVRRISQLFGPEDSTLFLGEDASEENVKSEGRLSRYRWIHFATHGLLNEKRPQFSGLVMSLSKDGNGKATSTEDGLLQVYEVFNLKLEADLVVLSACETGLGKYVNGEGLVGLTRAFIYAGTPAVVASLWKVSDASTADFMVRFYKHLQGGRFTRAEALRQAQLEFIGKTPFAHPYYWAPFVLNGRP